MVARISTQISSSSKILLLGAPCSGKGSLAQRISEKFNLSHISTGEIFRAHLREGTAFGEEIKQCMQEGILLPDRLVTNLTIAKLRSIKEGFILDGFPRTLSQAEDLQKYFDNLQAYHLYADDETVIQRLSGRLTCGSCGSIFNILFCPPIREGICDHCNETLIRRADDTREIVAERLLQHHTHTAPVIEFYKRLGMLTTINTEDLKPNEIFRRFFL